ncbi:hypothetical protein BUALT_Bualt08G0028400 [Buddleja alternifolia]|uniref:PH domain-containing protein n=1 Tax=Buddleja alternifolia TaxID=168488 RepID=A0AAV6XE37_9LAMI|nr:hypothetical protein BUALT_Bualt08G0028400 [Buddleja alternifolia]
MLKPPYPKNPGEANLRKKGLPHYPLCTEMFSGSVATGACSRSAAMDPIDADDKQEKDVGYMGGSSQSNVESTRLTVLSLAWISFRKWRVPGSYCGGCLDKFMSKMRRKIFLLQSEAERNAWLESFKMSMAEAGEFDPESDSDSENDEEHHPHASQQEIDAQSQFCDAMASIYKRSYSNVSTEWTSKYGWPNMHKWGAIEDEKFLTLSLSMSLYPDADRYYNEAPKHWASIKGIFREDPRQELPLLETDETAGGALDNQIFIPDTSTENSSPPNRILTGLTVRINGNIPLAGRSRQLAPRNVLPWRTAMTNPMWGPLIPIRMP